MFLKWYQKHIFVVLSHYILTADFLTDDEIDHYAQSSDDYDLNPDPDANVDTNDYEPSDRGQSRFASNMGTMLYWLLEILVEILTAL